MCTKTCHKRIRYKELECRYEMRGTDVIRMWICICDDVIREDNMSDIALRHEMEKGEW